MALSGAFLIVGVVAFLAAVIPSEPTSPESEPLMAAPAASPAAATARLLMVGDLMIGRRVGDVAAVDPSSVFADVAVVVGAADLAMANLESPLTVRPHSSENPHALEADPALAKLVTAAGFDVLTLANNHAGDAGSESILDTIAAVDDAGMEAVGAGVSAVDAWEPRVVEINGLHIAMLAIDVSRQGMAAADGPGVASWDEERAEAAVSQARASADVVVVSIHGGAEEWQGIDPQLDPAGRLLIEWGADIVWGHGPHVGQPVAAIEAAGGEAAILATSLGNFLFDQQIEPNSSGLALEALVDADGVVAWRLGRVRTDDLRSHFDQWLLPDGDAVLLDGEWWALARRFEPVASSVILSDFPPGDVIAAAAGNTTGDETPDLLVAYRHPFRESAVDPRPLPVDSAGRSGHVGVFELDGTPIWMSRRPPHPVGAVAACDGSAAFGYAAMDNPDVIAIGAGTWNGFGFTLAQELEGAATIGCADVDHDGLAEPIATR